MGNTLPGGIVKTVLKRPRLLFGMIRTAKSFAPLRWWSRPPYLPVPDKRYWKFRLETAYGGNGTQQPPHDDLDDVVDWVDAMRRFGR